MSSRIAGWQSGTFDPEKARLAWGVVAFAARHHGDELPAILDDMNRRLREQSLIVHDDGSWERIGGYRLPPGDQGEVLAHRLGDDWSEEVSEFFRKGRSYKPRKR